MQFYTYSLTKIGHNQYRVNQHSDCLEVNRCNLWEVFYVPETHIMYFIRRCWFLKCSEEIHYVPIGDGWEEVLWLFWAQMRLASLVPFQGLKKSRFTGPTPSNAPRNDVALLKTITYRAIKATGTLIVSLDHSPYFSLSTMQGGMTEVKHLLVSKVQTLHYLPSCLPVNMERVGGGR